MGCDVCGSCAPKPSACACEYLQFSLKHAPFKKSRHISSPPPPAPVEGETSGFDKLLLNCILKNSSLSSPIFFLCALLQPRDVCATCLRVCARVYKRAGQRIKDCVARSLEWVLAGCSCVCAFQYGNFNPFPFRWTAQLSPSYRITSSLRID